MTTVFLWSSTTQINSPDFEEAKGLLSSDELERAHRFHFDKDRIRFVLGRAFLRRVIASHLDQSPRKIKFKITTNGKPILGAPLPKIAPNGKSADALNFSFSRSENLAVCAVAKNDPIGVDVEKVIPIDDLAEVASTVFSNSEFELWQSIENPDQKLRTFYQWWTRKEARGKADGSGISAGAANIHIPTGELPIHAGATIKDENHWCFSEWTPRSSYVATIVQRSCQSDNESSPFIDHDRSEWNSTSTSDLLSSVPFQHDLTIRKFELASSPSQRPK